MIPSTLTNIESINSNRTFICTIRMTHCKISGHNIIIWCQKCTCNFSPKKKTSHWGKEGTNLSEEISESKLFNKRIQWTKDIFSQHTNIRAIHLVIVLKMLFLLAFHSASFLIHKIFWGFEKKFCLKINEWDRPLP